MLRLLARLSITLGVPLALQFFAEYLLLPGVPSDFLPSGRSHAMLGVFALGLTPVVSAYVVVECFAALVPRWRSLRHGDPEGRASLDRAVTVLSVTFAAFQGWGIAYYLTTIPLSALLPGSSELSISIPLVTVSLMGGVCVYWLAAQWITRHGLANGFVVLFAGGWIGDAVLNPRDLPVLDTIVAVGISGVATWVVLTAMGPTAPRPNQRVGDSPYRDAGQFVVHPWIPVPASSLHAKVVATALLTMWVGSGAGSDHRGFDLNPFGLDDVFHMDVAFAVAEIVATGLVMFVFARLMHRPVEMADLVRRLGARVPAGVDVELRRALRDTMLPSFLFLLAILLASKLSPDALVVPSLVAIALDLARSVKTAFDEPSMVRIWEERRASAVPVMRAALAADGIPSAVRGLGNLSLWQFFVPYAPAEILVRAVDAERGAQTLRLWSLEPGERESSDTPRPPISATPAASPPWSSARLALVLSLCVLAIFAGLIALRPEDAGSDVAAGPRMRLEVVRVDDTLDPFGDGEGLADGVELRTESVARSALENVVVRYAFMRYLPGEDAARGLERFRDALAAIPLPVDARFAIGSDERAHNPGLRAYVLRGESVLSEADVVDVMEGTDPRDGNLTVSVALSPDGARRFEDFTRAWVWRRAALLLDGEVVMAPLIRAAVPGGRVSITMGSGPYGEQQAAALRIVDGLRPR